VQVDVFGDHLGSIACVLDGNGSLETDERYTPFGRLRDTSGITETDFAFTGQRNLSDIGLMDYNARWYSPSIGRFISPDTLVAQPDNPQALNRYAYVANNTLLYANPSGYQYFPMIDGIQYIIRRFTLFMDQGNGCEEEDGDPPAPWEMDEGYDPTIDGIEP
jgi:RHS repeat-associated protein